MFETITLITIGLITFFAWQNKQLGLTAAVPKDPLARAHWQASQCLETFKLQLAGSVVKELAETRLRAALKDSAEEIQFWCEGGLVYTQSGASKPKKLHELGAAGSLNFRLLSEKALFVKIVADQGQAAKHEVGVRLEVSLDGPVFQAS